MVDINRHMIYGLPLVDQDPEQIYVEGSEYSIGQVYSIYNFPFYEPIEGLFLSSEKDIADLFNSPFIEAETYSLITGSPATITFSDLDEVFSIILGSTYSMNSVMSLLQVDSRAYPVLQVLNTYRDLFDAEAPEMDASTVYDPDTDSFKMTFTIDQAGRPTLVKGDISTILFHHHEIPNIPEGVLFQPGTYTITIPNVGSSLQDSLDYYAVLLEGANKSLLSVHSFLNLSNTRRVTNNIPIFMDRIDLTLGEDFLNKVAQNEWEG